MAKRVMVSGAIADHRLFGAVNGCTDFVTAKEQVLQPREIILLLALLCLGVSLRLIEISRPFVGEWSWRQADVAMIAENFYHNGFNIFYPQINWAGDYPGYVGTEFPLVPFIASLLYVF